MNQQWILTEVSSTHHNTGLEIVIGWLTEMSPEAQLTGTYNPVFILGADGCLRQFRVLGDLINHKTTTDKRINYPFYRLQTQIVLLTFGEAK